MNPSEGRFVRESEAEVWMQRIEVGEVVKVKGEEFEVLGFQGREIRLKLMNADDRRAKQLQEMFGDNVIDDLSKTSRFPKTPRKAG